MLRDHKGGVLGKDQGSLPKGSDVFSVSRTYPDGVGLSVLLESRTSYVQFRTKRLRHF